MAYDGIEELILRYELRPGQDEVARRLGMNLTPVRETLRILDREGHARRHPPPGILRGG